MTSTSFVSNIQVTIFSILSVIWYIILLFIYSILESKINFLAVLTTPVLNQIRIAVLHSHIKTSHSVIFHTQLCITDTFVSGVDNLSKEFLKASKLQFVSAFSTIFNCFKFHALILDISISIHDECNFF
jgi:hypothetical protein